MLRIVTSSLLLFSLANAQDATLHLEVASVKRVEIVPIGNDAEGYPKASTRSRR